MGMQIDKISSTFQFSSIKIEVGLALFSNPMALDLFDDRIILGRDDVTLIKSLIVFLLIISAATKSTDIFSLLSVMTILPPLRSSEIALSIILRLSVIFIKFQFVL